MTVLQLALCIIVHCFVAFCAPETRRHRCILVFIGDLCCKSGDAYAALLPPVRSLHRQSRTDDGKHDGKVAIGTTSSVLLWLLDVRKQLCLGKDVQSHYIGSHWRGKALLTWKVRTG